MQKITIPKPCHENWDNMSPNQNGRHCSSCAKTVIDFTQMTDDQVQHFLLDKLSERLCGRFSATQLQQIQIELPQNIFQLQLPIWKQFLVASLLVFSATLFSCDVNTKGEVISLNNTFPSIISQKINIKDTVPLRTTLGQPVSHKPVKCTTVKDPDKALMGDIEVLPQPNPRKLVGEIAVVQVKDTLIKKNEEPAIMGKMIFVPEKNPKKVIPKKQH